jgi:hypothetical protein
MGKIAKSPPIFVATVDNFSSISQILKEIATSEYEIKIINKQIKIQPKSFVTYVNIVKEVKSKKLKARNSTHTKRSKKGILE